MTTSAALPDDEPPALRVVSHGLRTGHGLEVKLAPEKQRSSHIDLPVTVAPAASRRVTAVASRRGTKPSTVAEPLVIGTPATLTLSLMATVLPASGPCPAPGIEVRTYQAPSGLSSGSDHCRCGVSGAVAA